MKHFDYRPLYKDIRERQSQELVDALQKYPNHEFHFGMDYAGEGQNVRTEHPYIIGYLGEELADLKVLAAREEDGFLYISVRDDNSGCEGTITEIRTDIALGYLENILDELPDV